MDTSHEVYLSDQNVKLIHNIDPILLGLISCCDVFEENYKWDSDIQMYASHLSGDTALQPHNKLSSSVDTEVTSK